jgi:Fe(3+) dicitrate transport protein
MQTICNKHRIRGTRQERFRSLPKATFRHHTPVRALAALCLTAIALQAAFAGAPPPARLRGRVLDPAGMAVPAARLALRSQTGTIVLSGSTDAEGRFELADVAPGDYLLSVQAAGFRETLRPVSVKSGQAAEVAIVLEVASFRHEVVVYGGHVVGPHLPEIPGSAEIVDSASIERMRPFRVDDVLRSVPGVFVKPSEEGFGLRPHIGLRGLDPTRSRKVLLLEDGIPLAYAPYGDNATYYHPPISRFDVVEVIKGAGQILYGPSTIGGVINYVTPPIPDRRSGEFRLTGGNRDFLSAQWRYGATLGRTGFLADATRVQGNGPRENIRLGYWDTNAKVSTAWSDRKLLTGKFSLYHERSQVTYSGLTEDEFRANPRQNPFANDRFLADRIGASLSYAHILAQDTPLTVNLYGSYFNRDWWRQSSHSGQRPNRLGDPGCTGMQDLLTRCGNEGRLRGYYLWGLEPRLKTARRWSGLEHEAQLGLRVHVEDQDRQQKNGAFPWARDGVLVEDNKRRTQAWSGFWQNRFGRAGLAVTPGLRWEHVRYYRNNRLNGAVGTATLTQWIPGIGVSLVRESLSVFGGLHRGFAPPRPEDIISNAGGTVDLDAELNWTYELGFRWRPHARLRLEATGFRMDYQNQIVPASVAGGIGATLTSAGRTLHQGLEWSGRWQLPGRLLGRHELWLQTSYTWLPVARFTGTRYSSVPGYQKTLVTGNRLPYAPRHLFSSALIYTHPRGANLLVEVSGVSRQFGDDLNTRVATPDGQRGLLPGHALWDATLNLPLTRSRTTLFVTVKNAFDRVVIVDRQRGILPAPPRMIQVGLRWRY